MTKVQIGMQLTITNTLLTNIIFFVFVSSNILQKNIIHITIDQTHRIVNQSLHVFIGFLNRLAGDQRL